MLSLLSMAATNLFVRGISKEAAHKLKVIAAQKTMTIAKVIEWLLK